MNGLTILKTSIILYGASKECLEMRKSKNLIYLAKRTDGKIYIGETKQELSQRIKSHLRKKQTEFEEAITKENMDDFEWVGVYI